MSTTSGDPVATIAEAEASGEIAALYADIRATLGVPVVNLIWRHLAVFPGGLDWAWQSLKPLYGSGKIANEARALREGLQIPALPGLSLAGLRALGLGDDDVAQIMMVLRSYERSNAMNIVALGALLARLDGASGSQTPAPSGEEGAVSGNMPKLLSLDDMAPHVRGLVEDLNTVGGRAEILASMYRHLANWPPYLALIQTLIAPFEAEGRLELVIRGAIEDGRRRAAGLAAGLAIPARAPDAETQAELRRVLGQFIDGPIGKMIAIVPLIRQAMPNPGR